MSSTLQPFDIELIVQNKTKRVYERHEIAPSSPGKEATRNEHKR